MNVEQEVVSLRRMVRIQGLVILAGLAVVGVVAAKKSGPQEAVEAKAFYLVNSDDKLVGDWIAEKNGSRLGISDAKAKLLVSLSGDDKSSSMIVGTPSGKNSIDITADQNRSHL